ncbi:putative quinol monooxygenase [Marinomonas polaris]|uniref:putative quinol monooxygenase n=1 Tax=Marinomonas polaris TaxID=293552 RepID=UPI003518D61B
MIILTGYVHLKPEDINEFVEDIRKITSSTRAEKGCLFYNIVVEDATVDTISPNQPQVFI